jgi:hypothetical protein
MDFMTLANQFHDHILDNIVEIRSQFEHRFWSIDPSDIHIHHLEWLAQFLFFSYQDTPRFSDATQAFFKVFKDNDPCGSTGFANSFFCEFLEFAIANPILPSSPLPLLRSHLGLFLKVSTDCKQFIEDFEKCLNGTVSLNHDNAWDTS